jgi:hypothetical protein
MCWLHHTLAYRKIPVITQLTTSSPQSSSEDFGQHDGDDEEEDEPDQYWMTQHKVQASPETQDIFLSIGLVSSEIDLAAVLFLWISLTII